MISGELLFFTIMNANTQRRILSAQQPAFMYVMRMFLSTQGSFQMRKVEQIRQLFMYFSKREKKILSEKEKKL